MASVYELDAKISSCIQLDEEHVVSVDDGEILNLQQFEALQMERDARSKAWLATSKTSLPMRRPSTLRLTSLVNVQPS